MNLDEELFSSLQQDLDICRDYIRQLATGMIRGGVSKFPIFVAQRGEQDLDLGVPLIKREDFDIAWNLSASHLEDFVNKGVVRLDKVEEFKKAYKNPEFFMCVFVAEESAGSFVFMPYDRQRDNLN